MDTLASIALHCWLLTPQSPMHPLTTSPSQGHLPPQIWSYSVGSTSLNYCQESPGLFCWPNPWPTCFAEAQTLNGSFSSSIITNPLFPMGVTRLQMDLHHFYFSGWCREPLSWYNAMFGCQGREARLCWARVTVRGQTDTGGDLESCAIHCLVFI